MRVNRKNFKEFTDKVDKLSFSCKVYNNYEHYRFSDGSIYKISVNSTIKRQEVE